MRLGRRRWCCLTRCCVACMPSPMPSPDLIVSPFFDPALSSKQTSFILSCQSQRPHLGDLRQPHEVVLPVLGPR